MTETDATRLPLSMPEKFIPYLDKYRIYKLFKDMLQDLMINLPRDHLKHMKVFMSRHLHSSADADNVIILVSDDLNIDVKKLVKELIKDLGFFVITRRCVMDRYELHDDYEPGCVSPILMSTVTKAMVLKEPVMAAGWLMYDHPCTVREARCLQQDGVLPTVTLYLSPPPPAAPPAPNAATASRSFWKQDVEGLKWTYQATLKEVWIEPDDVDDLEKMAAKCFNALRACNAGLQGPRQGFHVVGAPSYYRVLLIGPRGCGCRTQARMLARHFNLVNLSFEELYAEARERKDEVGERLRNYGSNIQLKAEIVRRRLLEKRRYGGGVLYVSNIQLKAEIVRRRLLEKIRGGGGVLYGSNIQLKAEIVRRRLLEKVRGGGLRNYGSSIQLKSEKYNGSTRAKPWANKRIIFLNAEWSTCKARAMSVGMDWCTGQRAPPGSGPRVKAHPANTESQIDLELETFFTESLAELRAAAGITAVEISAMDSPEEIQTRIQAAVISAPGYDIVNCSQIRNVRAD